MTPGKNKLIAAPFLNWIILTIQMQQRNADALKMDKNILKYVIMLCFIKLSRQATYSEYYC